MRSTGSHSSRETDRPGANDARPGGSGGPPGPVRPDYPPGLGPSARPSVLSFCAVLLVLLCSALAVWLPGRLTAPGGFALRDGKTSSNFHDTSAGEAPEAPREPPPGPPAGVPRPELLPAPSEETKAPPAVTVREARSPAPETASPWSGVSTMPYLQSLRVPLTLAAAFAGHAYAAAAEAEPGKAAAPDLVVLEKLLKETRDAVGRVEKAVGSEGVLRRQVDVLRQDVTRLEDEHDEARLGLQGLREEVRAMRARVARLEAQMKEQRERADGLAQESTGAGRTTRESRIVPAEPRPATATVRVSNTWTQGVSVIVNGRSYRVAAGETLTLDPQPAGALSYEVLGVQGPRTRTLVPGETRTINVYTMLP